MGLAGNLQPVFLSCCVWQSSVEYHSADFRMVLEHPFFPASVSGNRTEMFELVATVALKISLVLGSTGLAGNIEAAICVNLRQTHRGHQRCSCQVSLAGEGQDDEPRSVTTECALSSLPGLKVTTLRGGMGYSTLFFGLRPTRGLRALT